MDSTYVIKKFLKSIDGIPNISVFLPFVTRFVDDNYTGNSTLEKFLTDNIDFIIANFNISVDMEKRNCVEDVFDLADFMTDDVASIDRNKIQNIQTVYRTLLTPIAQYFKKQLPALFENSCILKINHGILSVNRVSELTGSNPSISSLVKGVGVDFSIIGVNTEDVISSIVNKNIDINFGVICRGEGIFITLPLTENETIIEKVYVYSLDGTLNNITHKLI